MQLILYLYIIHASNGIQVTGFHPSIFEED